MRHTFGFPEPLPRLALAAVIVTSLVSACGGLEKSADYDRHRYSQLTTARDRPDVIYFDVLFPAAH